MVLSIKLWARDDDKKFQPLSSHALEMMVHPSMTKKDFLATIKLSGLIMEKIIFPFLKI